MCKREEKLLARYLPRDGCERKGMRAV